MNYQKGFTFVELLVVTSIISVIAGTGIVAYRATQRKNDLSVATNVSVQALRRAQLLSQANAGDSQWGTKILPGSVVVFKGSSYVGRDSSYDEIYDIPSSVTVTDTTEIVYSKMYGLPQIATVTTLTSITNSVTAIAINTKGTIVY